MHLVTPPTPQAAQALADEMGARARFVARGTVVQQEWEGVVRRAPSGICFINTQAWPQTQTVSLAGEHLRIGANVRLEAVRQNPLVRAHAPLLVEAIGQLGAAGVRRLGTLGGNIAWGAGDTGPVLLVLDALAELADGTLEPLAQTLARGARPLMQAFHLPRTDVHGAPATAFEKVGYRAAFTPARVRVALRWADASRGQHLVRAAAGAPGTPIRRLHAVEAAMACTPTPTLADVRAACLRELPEPLAVMTSRLIAGHCRLL